MDSTEDKTEHQDELNHPNDLSQTRVHPSSSQATSLHHPSIQSLSSRSSLPSYSDLNNPNDSILVDKQSSYPSEQYDQIPNQNQNHNQPRKYYQIKKKDRICPISTGIYLFIL